MKKTFYILFAIALLMSCRDNGAYRTLLNAERLLETDVVAADSILESLTLPSSKRNQAWYAVLKTQADYKQYKPIISDSLILTATNYYGTNRKRFRSAMAWYTQGCVYSELNDDMSAIEAFLNAKDLFTDTLSRYYALIEQNIGDLLLKRDMMIEATDLFKQAKAISEQLNDSSMIVYSDFKQSLIYLYNKESEAANVLFLKLLDSRYISSYNTLKLYLGLSQISTFYEKDYYKSNSLTDYCIISESYRAAGYNQRGINYLFLNEIDSAIICFKESMKSQSDIYTDYSNYSFLTESYIRLNEQDSSLYYYSLCDMAVDSICTLLNHEEISSLMLSHTNQKNRAGVAKMKYVLYSSISIASIVILFLFILYFVQRDRYRKQYYIEKHDSLLEPISISSDDTFENIFNLSRINFEKSVGYTIINKGLGDRKISSNDSSVIKHDIRTCFKSLYKAILEKKYVVSKGEFECLICFLLKYDNKDTSLILDKGYSTVTSIKARLKNKIPKELLVIINDKIEY